MKKPALMLLLLLSPQAMAGGPFAISTSGVFAKWPNGLVTLHPETGDCAGYLNATITDLLNTNVSRWKNVSGANLTITIDAATLTTDVTVNNYTTYYAASSAATAASDNINPVIYDNGGTTTANYITTALFGAANINRVLGFAGPDRYANDASNPSILDAQVFINCACHMRSAHACAGQFTEADLHFVFVHEIGHLLGLDHTQVNQAIADDCSTSVANDCVLPTMYPVSEDPAEQITPARDDEVALLTLYGQSGWENSYVAVSGTLDDASANDLFCVDIQARTSSREDTVAVVTGLTGTISGTTTASCSGSSCNAFTLRGLDPSKTYTLYAVPISTQWTASGSTINPCNSVLPNLPSDFGSSDDQELAFTSNQITGRSAGSTVSLALTTTASSPGSGSGDSGSGSSSPSKKSSGCTLSKDDPHQRGAWAPMLFFLASVSVIYLVRRRKRCF